MRYLGLLLAVCYCQDAMSHSDGETYSKLFVDGSVVRISYNMRARQLIDLLPGLMRVDRALEKTFAELVVPKFRLRSGGRDCARVGAVNSRWMQDYVRVSWRVSCPVSNQLEIHNQALFNELPNHIHIARIRLADNRIVEKLMVRGTSTWSLETETRNADPFAAYLSLGIKHILGGYDHLAFLLSVLLLAMRLKIILWAITGFTVGHSMSLVIAVLGYANADGQSIEALIGFTIALVAAETVARRYGYVNLLIAAILLLLAVMILLGFSTVRQVPVINPVVLLGFGLFSVCYLKPGASSDRRHILITAGLTFLFGLIHGFGFAGNLLQVGLPTDRLVSALFGFNLGVEIGQVAFVTVFLSMVYFVLRLRPAFRHWFWIDGTASGLCGLGLFWFISRAL